MTDQKYYPQIDRLLHVMTRLRDPEHGCPWDIKQSFESIVPYTIEEVYEVADAIEKGDMNEIQDELGDLLFQIVFYAQLGKEQQQFDFEAIAKTIADKMVVRHPHVFANQKVTSEAQLNANWESIKHQEQLAKGNPLDTSVLANVPVGMAPLKRATKLQKKCARVGFDWTELAPVVDKIHEEVQEVMDEVQVDFPDQQAIEEEVGDLLFAVVNLSRHLKVDAETALLKANNKFEKRFRNVEAHFDQNEKSLTEASLDEMEAVWQKIKHLK